MSTYESDDDDDEYARSYFKMKKRVFESQEDSTEEDLKIVLNKYRDEILKKVKDLYWINCQRITVDSSIYDDAIVFHNLYDFLYYEINIVLLIRLLAAFRFKTSHIAKKIFKTYDPDNGTRLDDIYCLTLIRKNSKKTFNITYY